MKVYFIAILTIFISACVFTGVRETTDPDFIGFKLKKILIITPSYEFDNAFKEELKVTNLKYILMRSLFLRTRNYSPEERKKILSKQDFDEYLTINITNDQKSTRHGYSTQTNYNTYSSLYGTGVSQSTSTTPTTTSIRDSNATIKIFDVKSNRVMWIGDISAKAVGVLSMSNSSTASGMVEELVDTLIKKGHIEKLPLEETTE